MFQQDFGTSAAERLTIVFGHLQMESLYLDTIIESGLEIQKILRQQRAQSTEAEGDNETATQIEKNKQVAARLTELRDRISNNFRPVLEARKKLPDVLRTFEPDAKDSASLSSLLFRIPEPYRSRLKKLRKEIRTKLDQVYSITMGNQTVLIYTLNYYDQLLNGCRQPSGCYNASGLTSAQSFYKSTFVTTNC